MSEVKTSDIEVSLIQARTVNEVATTELSIHYIDKDPTYVPARKRRVTSVIQY